MAAYAAIVSLINTINLELIPHPTRSFNPPQTQLFQSISHTTSFVQEFLEGEWKESQHIESRIADAAYATEDAIGSNIVDQVLSGSPTHNNEGPDLLCQQLQKVMQDMDFIKIEAMKIIENGTMNDHRVRKSSSPAASLRAPLHKMVGFEEEKIQFMEELAGHHTHRQVIPIVGMGGSGKTTLVRNIYNDKFSVDHFDFKAWVTVSQEYDVNQIFRRVLSIETKGMSMKCWENKSTKHYQADVFWLYWMIFGVLSVGTS